MSFWGGGGGPDGDNGAKGPTQTQVLLCLNKKIKCEHIDDLVYVPYRMQSRSRASMLNGMTVYLKEGGDGPGLGEDEDGHREEKVRQLVRTTQHTSNIGKQSSIGGCGKAIRGK